MIKHAHIFKSLIQEIQRAQPKIYSNRANTIQSSVGLIFRVNCSNSIKTASQLIDSHLQKIELLFTQRAGFESDKNAYNVVFPGGQCDSNESDLQACKRELFEEIGLKVDDQCVYLGQFPKNFYYLKKRGKQVYISCHVWLMLKSELQWQANLNSAELRQYKWVAWEDLLRDQNYIQSNEIKFGVIDRMAGKNKIVDSVKQNISKVLMPELVLGMDRNLWGLTLWIWSYVLQMSLTNMQKSGRLNDSQSQIICLKNKIGKMSNLTVEFKPKFWLKYPSLLVIHVWQNFYRVRPFTYKRPDKNIKNSAFWASLVVIVLCYFIFSH